MIRRHKLNYRKSPVDLRDYIITITPPSQPLSETVVDISQFCTSVKDQGSIGSCTAHAVVACVEYIHKKYGGEEAEDIFSERFTYYVTRVNIAETLATEDNGAYVRDALKSIIKYGTCRESNCPYIDTGHQSDYAEPPQQICYTEASKFQALRYAKFPDVPSILERTNLMASFKKHLSDGIPIICGIDCYANIWDAADGVIPPLPNNGDAEIIGGHSILLVGFDDNRRLFKFKNSWGPSWGDNGYGYLPYDYYIRGHMADIWSLYTVEDLNRPIGINIMQPPPVVRSVIKNKLCNILSTVIDNIDVACHPQRGTILFTSLRIEHNAEPYISLISALRAQFQTIASNPS